MKIAKRMEEIHFSPIRKFWPYAVKAQEAGKKIYYFNIGQPDIKTPSVFMEAIRNFHEPVLEYMPSQGIPELIKAICGYYKGYGMAYEDEDIYITNGGSEGLCFLMAAILDDGDEVLTPEPFYTNYSVFVRYFGGKLVPITTKPEEGYHYADRDKIESLITPKTKAIMISNPSNPTGNVLTKEEMRMIMEIAGKHDLFVVADEAYREFVYDDLELGSFGQVMEGLEDHLVISDTISKRFSACGARIGALLTKNKVIKDCIMKQAQARLSAPTLEQVGAVALYSLDKSYFNETKAEYQRRRDVVFEELSRIEGVICTKAKGAFYMTVKLPVDSAEDFLVFMLSEFQDKGETMMFAPANGFYVTPGSGTSEIRLAYVLKEDDLRRGIELLRLGIEAYNNR